MKIVDTTYAWAQGGTINVKNQSEQELGMIDGELAKAGDPNFILNKLNTTQNSIYNEIDNVLIAGGLTPDGLTDNQLITAIENLLNAKINPNFITGFVASSSATVSDENIDITTGSAVCKDLTTYVKLTSNATNLSMPTLLGSALANSTTYHLFRYKKNDNTDQWFLSTSLTPTIADIKSANAYRRVFSFKTNSTGDIIKFYSIDLGRDLEIKYLENNGIKDLDTNTLPMASRSALTLSCPNNTEALLNVKFLDDDSTSDNVLLTEEVQTDSTPSVNVHTISAEDEAVANVYIKMKTNNSSQIYYRSDGANVGFLKIYTLGYITRRING